MAKVENVAGNGTSKGIQIEAALGEREELYRDMAEKSFAGVYIIQDGRFRFLNPNAASYVGHTPVSLIGTAAEGIVHPEDRDAVRKFAREMLCGKRSSPYEFRVYNKRGEIRWIIETVTPTVYQGRRAILGNSMDITEKKRAEEAMRASEEKYRVLAEKSFAGVYVIQDGKLVYGNRNTTIYSGYSPEEIIGREAVGMIHPDDRKSARENAVAMLRGDRASPYEYRMLTRHKGEIRWVMETATSILHNGRRAVLANSMDITDLKKSQKKLQELMMLESSLLASMPHAVFGLLNRRIIFVNDAAESVFGWSAAELIGESVRILYRTDQDYEEIGRKIYGELRKKPTIGMELDFPCRKKDGADIICRITGARVGEFLEDGKAVVTYEDITDKKKAQFQLLQSEKMASIGQLAAGVAHEINNPTAFVSSNLKTLSEYVNDMVGLLKRYRHMAEAIRDGETVDACREWISKHLGDIGALEQKMNIDFILEDIDSLIGDSREGTERISKIVQDLKNFAHPGDDKMKLIDINESLESTLSIAWNELKYKTTVHKQYGAVPRIPCYPQQINQVFMNLLVNAAQAIEDKGEITISTKAADGYVDVRIKDTGCGIPRENIPKLFDPFFTTKDVGKGTGLGLHVAYSIVKKHNGVIEVDSQVDAGTTFSVRLPVNQGADRMDASSGAAP